MIFFAEIERLLCTAADASHDGDTPPAARPRLGVVSCLHRFGSALNHNAHLHACVTDGVFRQSPDAPPAFLPAQPMNREDLAAVTERVRRRIVRWFMRQSFLDPDAAADMFAWEHSGVSVDATVRISLVDRDVPSYFRCLEHLLRYCARLPFALKRLLVIRGEDSRVARVRYLLPRHKQTTWVGPGRTRRPDPQPQHPCRPSSALASTYIGIRAEPLLSHVYLLERSLLLYLYAILMPALQHISRSLTAKKERPGFPKPVFLKAHYPCHPRQAAGYPHPAHPIVDGV